LERHRRRETAPSLAKNTSIATQQDRAPNALATRFLLIAAGILGGADAVENARMRAAERKKIGVK